MIKKFFLFSIGTWIGALIGIITIPVLTHYFSPDDFGKASMFALVLNALMVITLLGVNQAFIRFYYEEDTKRLLSKCLIINFFVFILTMVLVYFFRIQLSMYLFDVYAPEMILILGIATFVSVLNSYTISIFRMDQDGILYSITQIGLRLFELLFVFLFLLFLKKDYSIMVYAKVLTLLLITIYAVYIKRETWINLTFNSINAKYSYQDILSFGFPIALTGLITWAFQSIDRLALKEWSTLVEIGIYTAAFKIVLILQMVQTSFTTYWVPLSYDRFIKKSDDADNKLFFSKVSQIISWLMLLCGVLVIMIKDLIPSILGRDYSSAVTMIPFLIFMPVMYTISETTTIGLNFYKKVKIILLISVLTLMVNVICNYIFVPRFNGIGAALSTCISSIVFYLLRTFFSLKYYPIDFRLLKFYLLLIALFLYAFYSTFYTWDIFNLIVGLILIFIITMSYSNIIKEFAVNIRLIRA